MQISSQVKFFLESYWVSSFMIYTFYLTMFCQSSMLPLVLLNKDNTEYIAYIVNSSSHTGSHVLRAASVFFDGCLPSTTSLTYGSPFAMTKSSTSHIYLLTLQIKDITFPNSVTSECAKRQGVLITRGLYS